MPIEAIFVKNFAIRCMSMKDKITEYTAGHRMRDLIDDNNLLLMVISRFGIPLGFGDRTVAEVCAGNNVDCPTFLTVANFISFNDISNVQVSLPSLMGYLQRAHSYFLDFILPNIRRKLIEAINCSDTNDVAFLILKFYDDYVMEVRRHMEYENESIFSYVEKLLDGEVSSRFKIAMYSAHHGNIAEKLNELKDIIIRHYIQHSNDMLNSVLYDIINCENDLMSHCEVENRLLVPEVERLEKKLYSSNVVIDAPVKEQAPNREMIDSLSDREKDIIKCVARGLSNKEIASELCLSIHTVTTHRRNLSSKLQIHSPAGLTIFAIIHNLIDLKDIKL